MENACGSAPRSLTVDKAKACCDDLLNSSWLREAEALQIWRPLGMVSALDYMERVLGFAPRTAKERLRVARALGALPELERALETGELAFSAVRELTRVASATTEHDWIERARGKNLREIEELVAGHQQGDMPDDPPTPELRTHRIELEVSAATFARLRQARAALADEHGRHLDDDDFVAALAECSLEGRARQPGTAKFQVAISVCPKCRAGSQDGAGAVVAIDAATIERAECDAQRIGTVDGEAPARAMQDVPPATARLVWRRDHGRCRVPGCRSARGLEIHHIVRRADGGSHEPTNLVLLCSACHKAHHDRRLTISGMAADLRVQRAPVGAFTTTRTDTIDALVGMGWKPAIARAATDSALVELDPSVSLVDAIRAALRHCT